MSQNSATSDAAPEPMLALLERLYGPLVKQLQLPPEQSAAFYQAVLEHKTKCMAQQTELLRHGDLSRMSRTLAEFQKETDARLQSVLGEALYSRYQEYQTGIGDRGILESMRGHFAECPLTDEQTESLLATMAAGRKAATGVVAGGDSKFNVADSSDRMKEKLARQELIDRHVLERAADFLAPAQLEVLRSVQSKMMSARKVGYAKAQEMFGERR